MKRIALRTATAAAVLLIIPAAVAGLAAAGSPPSPSPSPTASPTQAPTPSPVVTPASLELVRWALARRRVAHRRWAKWDRARDCFELPSRVFRPVAPARTASAEAWTKAGKAWKANGRDYLGRFRRLRHEMKRPGGPSSGIRWLPLARWVGWPQHTLSTLAPLIMNESSGRERAVSPTHDYGLTQLNRCHAAKFRQVIGKSFYPHALSAEHNLRFALWLWEAQGGCFKPAWSGDPAVGR